MILYYFPIARNNMVSEKNTEVVYALGSVYLHMYVQTYIWPDRVPAR